jgi:hypothetical protein
VILPRRHCQLVLMGESLARLVPFELDLCPGLLRSRFLFHINSIYLRLPVPMEGRREESLDVREAVPHDLTERGKVRQRVSEAPAGANALAG